MLTFETKTSEVFFKKQLASVLAYTFKACSCQISFFDSRKQMYNVSKMYENENLLNTFFEKFEKQLNKVVSNEVKNRFKESKPQTAKAVLEFLVSNLD